MTNLHISRRKALIAGATLPFAPLLATPARATAPMQGPAPQGFSRFKLGVFEVTPLLAGTRAMDKPQETFGTNASAEQFAALSAENFIPADKSVNFFTPVLVNTGAELILFDTGLAPDAITAALASAGVTPDQVDTIVLTHMHGDHIGGISGEAGVTFAKARYVTGQVEFDHWSKAGNEGFDTKVKPLAEKFTFLGDGGSVASGITAVAAFGHSPGHMAFHLESAGQRLMLTADTANHYVWSLQRPEWEVRFDADKAVAAQTRKDIFGMIAADRIPFTGYHMPFPATGHVEDNGEGGFRFVPVSYQLLFDA
jgi:glyoxylase-like metal-dependent hydrolase (beta-lactamase superfamily II)